METRRLGASVRSAARSVGTTALDAAFGHPRGPLGRVGGVVMGALNAEMARVLHPDGRLVVSCHQHVLPTSPESLQREAAGAGFEVVELSIVSRRRNSPAVELAARRA